MTKNSTPAEPPGGGRQDHEVMRLASLRPVTGPASTDTLAASGGLEVPGLESHIVPSENTASVNEPIPGERDPATLTVRERGAIGGRSSGADTPSPDPHTWIDEETARLHEIEGGGT